MKFMPVILFVFFISCQSSISPESSKMQIAKVLFDQQTAWNNGDIEQYMAGYQQSDSLRFASGGNVTYGWLTTLDRYKKGYPNKSAMGILTFSRIDIQLISNDAALVFGKWELERESDHPEGFFTLLFRKTNADWKIVSDHTSSARN